MPIPIRTLRTHLNDHHHGRPMLSARELDREDRILDTARILIARYGRANLTFTSLAAALRIAPATIRRHFPELDSILYDLIRRHLTALLRAVCDVRPQHPKTLFPARRAAYVAFTRNGFSGTTPDHTLLIRERHTLPPDLAEQIEQTLERIGNMLATDHTDTTLILLDNPFLQPRQIEAMLTTLAKPKAIPIKHNLMMIPEQAAQQTIFQQAAIMPQARAGPN